MQPSRRLVIKYIHHGQDQEFLCVWLNTFPKKKMDLVVSQAPEEIKCIHHEHKNEQQNQKTLYQKIKRRILFRIKTLVAPNDNFFFYTERRIMTKRLYNDYV